MPSIQHWLVLSAGDLCLILIDQVEAALAYIQGKVNESNWVTAQSIK
jgi:cyanophycin synthetase